MVTNFAVSENPYTREFLAIPIWAEELFQL